MRTLLLYDSTAASTKQLARVIAEVLGEHSSLQMIPLAQARDLEVANADWLLIGGATQRRTLAPLLRGWLASLPRGAVDGMPVALFDTRERRSGTAAGAAAELLAQELQRRGAILLAPPITFLVVTREGPLRTSEVARALRWARAVLDQARQWAQSFQQATGGGNAMDLSQTSANASAALPVDASPEERMRALIDTLSAYIEYYHGGAVEMVSFDGATLKIRMKGACLGCPLSPHTLHGWVEGTVRQFFPRLKEVQSV